MMGDFGRFTLLIFGIFSCGNGAKILLTPIPTGSHVMNFHQMAVALREAGHEVHALVDTVCKSTTVFSKSGFTVHHYDPPNGCLLEDPKKEAQMARMIFDGMSPGAFLEILNEMIEAGEELSQSIYPNETLFRQMKAENFDLCIVDGLIYFRHMYITPYKLGLPYVTFLATFNPVDASIPALPSFSPTIDFAPFTDEMSFTERLLNTIYMFAIPKILTTFISPIRDGVVATYAPEKPYRPLSKLPSDSLLWLVQNEIAIDYPQVRLPHVVNIGGTNVEPGKELASRFAEIVENAPDGVIIVTFGSMLKTYPPPLSARLLRAFRPLKQAVIWRHDGKNIEDVPSHVHLTEWVPQNDLLAHPNVKVFVTHCGANGQFEALYHAVPMLGLPLFADQLYNCKRMAKKGLGITMDTSTFDPDMLRENIEEILYNETYKANAIKHAQIFKDRPLSPKETMIYWINHVIKYGAKHLRSRCIDMPWHQFWCVDIVCTYLLLTAIVIFATYKVTRWLVKSIYNVVVQQQKSASKPKKLKKK